MAFNSAPRSPSAATSRVYTQRASIRSSAASAALIRVNKRQRNVSPPPPLLYASPYYNLTHSQSGATRHYNTPPRAEPRKSIYMYTYATVPTHIHTSYTRTYSKNIRTIYITSIKREREKGLHSLSGALPRRRGVDHFVPICDIYPCMCVCVDKQYLLLDALLSSPVAPAPVSIRGTITSIRMDLARAPRRRRRAHTETRTLTRVVIYVIRVVRTRCVCICTPET